MNPRLALTSSLILLTSACNDTPVVELVPSCDDIDWPLGDTPALQPPVPDFDVECVHGWGNDLPTRPPSETVAYPADSWALLAHPQGGLLMVPLPIGYDEAWISFLEEQGLDRESSWIVWVGDDGRSVNWATSHLAGMGSGDRQRRALGLGSDGVGRSGIGVLRPTDR